HHVVPGALVDLADLHIDHVAERETERGRGGEDGRRVHHPPVDNPVPNAIDPLGEHPEVGAEQRTLCLDHLGEAPPADRQPRIRRGTGQRHSAHRDGGTGARPGRLLRLLGLGHCAARSSTTRSSSGRCSTPRSSSSVQYSRSTYSRSFSGTLTCAASWAKCAHAPVSSSPAWSRSRGRMRVWMRNCGTSACWPREARSSSRPPALSRARDPTC